MISAVIRFDKFKGFSLMALVVSVLLVIGMTYEGTFVSSFENAYAQQGPTNMTTPGNIMTGGGGMQHEGGQGMSGMSGMQHGVDHTPGMTNEMCSMGEDMPPHYCEPSYQVMSSVKGVKISNVNILNDTSVMVSVSELNHLSNNTVEDIVIVGGGGDLSGSTILEGNWKQNTTSTLNFEGTGSAYSTDKLTVHIFSFNG